MSKRVDVDGRDADSDAEGEDAGSSANGSRDGGLDSAPLVAPRSALGFDETFEVRSAVRLGEGVLVVGFDAAGDRSINGRALAAYFDDAAPERDWAKQFGPERGSEQFTAAVRLGADALVIGTNRRSGSTFLHLSRFDSAGSVETAEFSVAESIFVSDMLVIGDEILAAGQSGGRPALFRIDVGLATLFTTTIDVNGTWGSLAEFGGTLYAAGNSLGDGIYGEFPLRNDANVDVRVHRLANAEFSHVAASTVGAVVVGSQVGMGLRVAIPRGDGGTVVERVENAEQLRQVAFVGEVERYVGTSNTRLAFIAERDAQTLRTATLLGTTTRGGRVADFDEGFVASQSPSTTAPRVQLLRFDGVGADIPCTSPGRASFERDPGAELLVSFETTSLSATGRVTVVLDQAEDPFRQEAGCPR